MYAIIFWSVMVISALSALASMACLVPEDHALRTGDVLLAIVPFAVWWSLLFFWHRPKSLSNLFEPFVLVPIIAAWFLVRVFAFRSSSHTRRSIAVLVLGSLSAAALYAFMPVLPE